MMVLGICISVLVFLLLFFGWCAVIGSWVDGIFRDEWDHRDE